MANNRVVSGPTCWFTISTIALMGACAAVRTRSAPEPLAARASNVAGAPPAAASLASAGTTNASSAEDAGGAKATTSSGAVHLAEGGAPSTTNTTGRPAIGVAYWATPQPIVDKMLELAAVKSGDVVYDLGCGDGRSLVTAATRYGARGVGVDINPQRVAEARENVRRNNVEHLVEIRLGDMFFVDLSQADVVFLYMVERFNEQLKPQFAKLHKGARIVSHEFPVPGIKPKRIWRIPGPPDGPPGTDGDAVQKTHLLYLWEVPWRTGLK